MSFNNLASDYKNHGLAGCVGFGERPALLVVDFIKAYTTPDPPLYAAPGIPDVIDQVVTLRILVNITD